MTIATGQHIPDVKVFTFGDSGPEPTTSEAVLGSGKVALFAVPGAFTPTCSDHHLPGFVLRADELKAKGVDKIVCVAINDPFKGAELVSRIGRPDQGRHSLQIEVNRGLYMDEDKIEKRADFDRFKADMDRLIAAIASFVAQKAAVSA